MTDQRKWTVELTDRELLLVIKGLVSVIISDAEINEAVEVGNRLINMRAAAALVRKKGATPNEDSR